MGRNDEKFKQAEEAWERWCASSNPNPGGQRAQTWRSAYVSALIDIESGRVPGFVHSANNQKGQS